MPNTRAVLILGGIMKILKISSSLLIGLFVLSGCASYPEYVKVPDGTNLVSYDIVKTDGNELQGLKARWSGIIAGVVNKARQTQFDILYYPSNGVGRPKIKDEPLGRFRVYVDAFLDPEIYQKGREVIVLGTVTQKETQKIGEYDYEYPTLKDAKIHLWKKNQDSTDEKFFFGWYGKNPHGYWDNGNRHHHIIRVIKNDETKRPVTKNN